MPGTETSPIYGLQIWAGPQAQPWTLENTVQRAFEAVLRGSVADRNLADAPGACDDGAAYLVAAGSTGGDPWEGHAGEMAVAVGVDASNGWIFIPIATEGQLLWVDDEAVRIEYVGAAWTEFSGGGGSTAVEQWAPNFTADGNVYIPADDAMTIAQGNAKIGTGTIAFEKSTAAAPGTFSSTTLPATLEAGAWLKVAATGVTGFVATHLVRS